MIVFQNPTKN